MSVIDEGAKSIVNEAAEAGTEVNDPRVRSRCSETIDEMSVNEALDVAQAWLAASVAGDKSLPGKSEAQPSESRSPTPSAQEPPTEDVVAPRRSQAIDPTGTKRAYMDQDVAVVSCEPIEPPRSGLCHEPTMNSPSTSTGTPIDTAHVENAVVAIEQGIHKLVSILPGELQVQWTRAHTTENEVDKGRAKFDEKRKATHDMLAEISSLRDEARATQYAGSSDSGGKRESARTR